MITSAQEAGLILVASAVRQLVPPQLEAVIIVYPPGKPEKVSSVIATVAAPRAGAEQVAAFERAKAAAKAFVEQRPNNPQFNPQS